MAKRQQTAALRQLAAAEARDRKPGSVIVKFKRVCHRAPLWRRALGIDRDEDFTVVWPNSVAVIQGDTIQVQTGTPSGTIQRFLNWRDLDSVVCIPAIELPPKEETSKR